MEQQENRVVLRGTVAEEATLSHQVHGIAFYRFPLAVPRLSGREDRLNIPCPKPGPLWRCGGRSVPSTTEAAWATGW